MSRRTARFNKPLQQVVVAAAGYTLSKQINRIEFLNANPLLRSGAKIAAGLFLTTQRNQFAKDAGLGVAVAGGVEMVETLLPVAGVAGIAGRFPFNSVAGGYNPLVVVE